eukprot:m.27889 g.27889  ORF g.27889 m.27889 type:complete len:228 (-) comp5991_c0_seq1:277-960(-)
MQEKEKEKGGKQELEQLQMKKKKKKEKREKRVKYTESQEIIQEDELQRESQSLLTSEENGDISFAMRTKFMVRSRKGVGKMRASVIKEDNPNSSLHDQPLHKRPKEMTLTTSMPTQASRNKTKKASLKKGETSDGAGQKVEKAFSRGLKVRKNRASANDPFKMKRGTAKKEKSGPTFDPFEFCDSQDSAQADSSTRAHKQRAKQVVPRDKQAVKVFPSSKRRNVGDV